MSAPPPVSHADRQRAEAMLPWYVNGTLDPTEAAWLQELLTHDAQLMAHCEAERLLAARVDDFLEPAPQDVGLEALQARLRAARTVATGRPQEPSPGTLLGRLLTWFDGLAGPRLAYALLALVVVQSSYIGYRASVPQPDYEATRHVTVEEVRTLRVRFVDSVPEGTLRAAIVAAGGHIVGGPDQLGEYWLSSSLVSLEEMRQSLLKSGVLVSAEVDLKGPQ